MLRMTAVIALLFALGCTAVPGRVQQKPPPPPGKDLTAYFVGNSLTGCIPLNRLEKLFDAAGGNLEYGKQGGGGHRLQQHLSMRNWANKPGEGTYGTIEKYGPWPEAFANHEFDAIILQPYRHELDAPETVLNRWPWWTAGSLQAASGLITAARGKVEPGEGWYHDNYKSDHVASDRFYIYATWPPVGQVMAREGEKTYSACWNAEYEGGEHTCADLYEKMVTGLNKRHPDLPVPVRMIPSGHVMAALDVKIRNGELPGIEEFYQRNMDYFIKARRNGKKKPAFDPDSFDHSGGILNVYADNVHMNDQPHTFGTIGSYITAATHFATLSGESPVGLTVEPYEQLDPEKDAELIRAIQETIWEVVTSNEYTGVQAD